MAPVAFFQLLFKQSPLLFFGKLRRDGFVWRRRIDLAALCGRAGIGWRRVIWLWLIHVAEKEFSPIYGQFSNRFLARTARSQIDEIRARNASRDDFARKIHP